MSEMNETNSVDIFKLFVVYGQLTTPLLGILINLLVFLIGSCVIRQSYRHYLSNLAVIDSIFALAGLLVTVNNQLHRLPFLVKYTADVCSFLAMPLMSVALVPICVDRYLKICRQARLPRLLSPPLICVLFDLVPVAVIVTATSLGYNSIFDKIYMVLFPLLSLLVVFICNIKLLLFISTHMTRVASWQNKVRLMQTKQLVRATCIQAITPLLMQLPSLVGIFSLLLAANRRESNERFLRAMGNIFWLVILSNPLVDGIVTLLLVKDYRSKLSPTKCVICCQKVSNARHQKMGRRGSKRVSLPLDSAFQLTNTAVPRKSDAFHHLNTIRDEEERYQLTVAL